MARLRSDAGGAESPVRNVVIPDTEIVRYLSRYLSRTCAQYCLVYKVQTEFRFYHKLCSKEQDCGYRQTITWNRASPQKYLM